MPPPLQLGLGMGLAKAGGPGLDPDAVAFMDAIYTAGGSVSVAESVARSLTSDYFKDLKNSAEGDLFALQGRMVFHVWNNATANAICAKSLQSGSFVGNVTHAVGKVSTTSPTGHFLADASPSAVGASNTDASIWSIGLAGVQDFMGCGGALNSRLLVGKVGFDTKAFVPSTASGVGSSTNNLGFIVANRKGTTTSLYRRTGAGWQTPESVTGADAIAPPAYAPAFLGNFNNTGTVSTGRTATGDFCGSGYGLGYTDAQAELFTSLTAAYLNALTGLSLP